MKTLRNEMTVTEAQAIAVRLKSIDYELIDLVTGTSGLTLRAADQLAAMQRRLRVLRYAMESERGFETPHPAGTGQAAAAGRA